MTPEVELKNRVFILKRNRAGTSFCPSHLSLEYILTSNVSSILTILLQFLDEQTTYIRKLQNEGEKDATSLSEAWSLLDRSEKRVEMRRGCRLDGLQRALFLLTLLDQRGSTTNALSGLYWKIRAGKTADDSYSPAGTRFVIPTSRFVILLHFHPNPFCVFLAEKPNELLYPYSQFYFIYKSHAEPHKRNINLLLVNKNNFLIECSILSNQLYLPLPSKINL